MALEKESWMNSTKGLVQVRKFDSRGQESVELVRSGKQILLTPDERVALNSDRAATDKQDNFKNGTMVPVRLLDSTEDAAEIASNPNLKSEGDLEAMVASHHKTFEKDLEAVTNVSTLKRLREVAIEKDSSVGRVRKIDERISELSGESVSTETVQSFGEPSSGYSAGVTPG